MKALKSSKGFTLIEIIAVLVILGILAVAVPKYIDMQGEAKKAAAKGQVAEIKSTLNLAYAKAFLAAGAKPNNIAAVINEAGITTTMGVPPDEWGVKVESSGNTTAKITVSKYNGQPGYDATGTWNLPQ